MDFNVTWKNEEKNLPPQALYSLALEVIISHCLPVPNCSRDTVKSLIFTWVLFLPFHEGVVIAKIKHVNMKIFKEFSITTLPQTRIIDFQ
jgi:hypothetical protein